jgi:iron complex transport system substrate-binding protein
VPQRDRFTRPLLPAAALAGLAALALAGCGTSSSSATAAADGAGSTNIAGTDGAPTAAGATKAADAFPVTIVNCGRKETFDSPPTRAVSINQPANELLLGLGLADRMAGTASWGDPVLPRLAAANAKVPLLSRDFPSFERVLKSDPDFVYTTFDYTFTNEGVAPRDRFEQLGVPTYQSSSECGGQDARQSHRLTIDDVYDEIGDIAKVFGVSDRGARLVGALRARLAKATDGLDARGVSLMWWYSSTKTPYIAGCCGAPGIITRALGATNAFDSQRQLWPEIGWEPILAKDPDVIVIADLTRGSEGDSAAAKIKFLENDPVASRLTAVRKHRFIVLPGSDMDPSIRNVNAVERVAAGLRRLGVVGR